MNVSNNAIQIFRAGMALAQECIAKGCPIDEVVGAFQSITAALSADGFKALNGAAQAQTIQPATVAEAEALKRRNGFKLEQ